MFDLVHGSCFDVDFPKARLMLTDVPYGVVTRGSGGLRIFDKGKADIETFDLLDFAEGALPFADIFVIFCGKEQFSSLFAFFREQQGTVRAVAHCKSNPSPMNGEFVLLDAMEFGVFFKKKGAGKLPKKCVKSWFEAPTGSSKFHPTEKNHKLLAQIIEATTSEGDLVIDPLAGSGSTGIVARKLGRAFFGTELDKDFFDVARARLCEGLL